MSYGEITVSEEAGRVYSKQELDTLIELAQRGQPQAREEIFRFLRARFLALAKLRVGVDDAQDVVQETLIVVSSHFVELHGAESLLAFTNEVMRNKIGNFYRKRDRRKQHHVEWEDITEPAYTMDEQLEAAALDRMIRKAIDQLGEKRPRCRALLLGLCEGLSIAQLSQHLQLPRPRVDDWLFRCRKALRQILLDHDHLRGEISNIA